MVLTDHSALKWLMNQKELSGRLARWSLKLQGYQFDIQNRKGSQNVADTLSRLNVDKVNMFVNGQPIIDLSSKEFQSTEYLELIKNIKKNSDRLPDLKIQYSFIYKRTLPSDGHMLHEFYLETLGSHINS